MVYTMLWVAFLMWLANTDGPWLPSAKETEGSIRPVKIESADVWMFYGRLQRTIKETCYKECRYTVQKNGRAEEVVKQVPYYMTRWADLNISVKELAAFDRRGYRIDPVDLPKLFKEPLPVLIVSVAKVEAESVKSLKKERAI